MLKECPYCEEGNVDLFINGEYQESITCSECDGNGNMTIKEHGNAISGINALAAAMAEDHRGL